MTSITMELEKGETCYKVDVIANVRKYGDEYEVGAYDLYFYGDEGFVRNEIKQNELEAEFFAQNDTDAINDLLIESYEG